MPGAVCQSSVVLALQQAHARGLQRRQPQRQRTTVRAVPVGVRDIEICGSAESGLRPGVGISDRPAARSEQATTGSGQLKMRN